MPVNKEQFEKVVTDAKTALERLPEDGSMTPEDAEAIRLLATTAIATGKQILLEQNRQVPETGKLDGSPEYTRDRDYKGLAKRTWLLADYWVKNINAIDIEPKEVGDEVAGSNGVWALAANANEIVDRPTRKTADGGGHGDGPPTEPAWLARIEEKINTILALVSKF